MGVGQRTGGPLVAKGLVTGAGEYVGLGNHGIATNAGRELAALLNLPVEAKGWPPGLAMATAAGLSVLVAVFFSLQGDRTKEPSPNRMKTSRIVMFGAALGIVPALLTAILAKHWWPYYACFPAIGTSLLLAMATLKAGARLALPLVGVFLILGVWARGTEGGARATATEQNFRRISARLKRIDSQLHKLHPSFPDSSRLYVTVNMPEATSVQFHLFSLQAPRVWYSNRTLLTDDPGRLHPGTGREYLFSVTPQGMVFEIELPGLRVVSPEARPDQREYQAALRSFSYGLAAQGHSDTDRAVDLLLRMQEPDSLTWAFDRRLAATFLLAKGREDEAQRLLRGVPGVPRSDALYAVAAVLGPELPGLHLDEAVFRVYEIPPNDVESYRFLMRHFSDQAQLPQTRRMANRLIALVPGDEEASAMIAALDQASEWRDNSVPWLRK